MQPNEVQPRYFSMADASAYTGYSVRVLRQLIKDGRLPATKITASQQGHVRIRIDDLDALMARNRA